MDLFQTILDQSEVWSSVIPLVVLGFHRNQPKNLQPVIYYLWFALAIYLLGNIVADHKELFPEWLTFNTYLYNIHSLVRFLLFTIFFEHINQRYYNVVRKSLPVLSLVFVAVNFTFYQYFFYKCRISSRLLTVESYLLLINCMLYYLSQLKEEVEAFHRRKDFWITTGLSFYVVINFFVFLFYSDLSGDLANSLWNIHNIAQIIFFLFIAKAFYVPYNHR